jgi:hypothetical protein
MNKRIVIIRKALLQAYGNRCTVCGSTENLEFAHKVPTGLSGRGRGRKERYYDIIKYPLDYTLTCKKDNKSVEEIPSCRKQKSK